MTAEQRFVQGAVILTVSVFALFISFHLLVRHWQGTFLLALMSNKNLYFHTMEGFVLVLIIAMSAVMACFGAGMLTWGLIEKSLDARRARRVEPGGSS